MMPKRSKKKITCKRCGVWFEDFWGWGLCSRCLSLFYLESEGNNENKEQIFEVSPPARQSAPPHQASSVGSPTYSGPSPLPRSTKSPTLLVLILMAMTIIFFSLGLVVVGEKLKGWQLIDFAIAILSYEGVRFGFKKLWTLL